METSYPQYPILVRAIKTYSELKLELSKIPKEAETMFYFHPVSITYWFVFYTHEQPDQSYALSVPLTLLTSIFSETGLMQQYREIQEQSQSLLRRMAETVIGAIKDEKAPETTNVR